MDDSFLWYYKKQLDILKNEPKQESLYIESDITMDNYVERQEEQEEKIGIEIIQVI